MQLLSYWYTIYKQYTTCNCVHSIPTNVWEQWESYRVGKSCKDSKILFEAEFAVFNKLVFLITWDAFPVEVTSMWVFFLKFVFVKHQWPNLRFKTCAASCLPGPLLSCMRALLKSHCILYSLHFWSSLFCIV